MTTFYSQSNVSIETGISWTTDAPYRETQSAIDEAQKLHVVFVEMEAAALYAFAKAKYKQVIYFAHLTNTMVQTEGDFEKGEEMGSLDTLKPIQQTMNAIAESNGKY